jgi:hypothetical protein
VTRSLILLFLATTLAHTTSCAAETSWDDPGPEDVFETFLTHWFLGEDEKAFAMVAPSSREVIEAPRTDLVERVPEAAVPEPHEMLVVGRMDNPYRLKGIDTVRDLEAAPTDGETVGLVVEHIDGEKSHATMIWSDEQWFVALPVEGAASSQASAGADATGDGGATAAQPDAGSAHTGRVDAGSSLDAAGATPEELTDEEKKRESGEDE